MDRASCQQQDLHSALNEIANTYNECTCKSATRHRHGLIERRPGAQRVRRVGFHPFAILSRFSFSSFSPTFCSLFSVAGKVLRVAEKLFYSSHVDQQNELLKDMLCGSNLGLCSRDMLHIMCATEKSLRNKIFQPYVKCFSFYINQRTTLLSRSVSPTRNKSILHSP